MNPKQYIYFIFMLVSGGLFSQEVKAVAVLDTNTIVIGQQAKLTLSVEYRIDKGIAAIHWPGLKDTITKNIEIVRFGKIDTVFPDKQNEPYRVQQVRQVIITSFDSGYFAIPPFRFTINKDTNNIAETEALLLNVHTVQVDTLQAIKDIKAPLEEPFHWRELLPYIKWFLIGSAAIAVLMILYHFYKPKKKEKVIAAPVLKIPPHTRALEALEKLREQKLWQEGKIKLYYSGISDILRVYIEERFKVNAMEQTSHEILSTFRNLVIDSESKELLRQVLILADLVKFAKEQPLPHEHEMTLSNAIAFVNGTKREEENAVGSGSSSREESLKFKV